MAKLSLLKGTTSYSAYIFIQDSSVTTGAGLTGLVFNSSNLVASYVRPLAARVAISLVTQTVTGAYSSGGFVEIDATNMPGVYRLDVPNAALATGVGAVVVMLKGATNMVPCVLEIELTAVDNQNATTGGLTNLDAAITTRAVAGDAMALTTAERNSTADALLDRSGAVETGLTVRQAFRLALAALAGKASGLATNTAIYRNAVADSKARITATVDADGNRTAITYDST